MRGGGGGELGGIGPGDEVFWVGAAGCALKVRAAGCTREVGSARCTLKVLAAGDTTLYEFVLYNWYKNCMNLYKTTLCMNSFYTICITMV